MNGLTKDQINWRKHGRSECPDCGIKINPDYNEGTSGCILCFDEGRYARSIHDSGRPRDPKRDFDDWEDAQWGLDLDDVVTILPQDDPFYHR